MESKVATAVPASARRMMTVLAGAFFAYAIRTWLINRNEQRHGPSSRG